MDRLSEELSKSKLWEARVNELAQFGLSLVQARTYVTLLELGVSPVGKVALMSKLHRVQVYRALGELKRHGLVEEILGTPRAYRAADPVKALQMLLSEAEQRVKTLAENREKLATWLCFIRDRRAHIPVGEEGGRFELVWGRRRTAEKRSTMLISGAKEILYADSASAFLYWLRELGLEGGINRWLNKLAEREVRVQALTEINETNVEEISGVLKAAKAFKGLLELRHVPRLMSQILIVDDGEVLVGGAREEDLFQPEDQVKLWSSSQDYVHTMKRFFNELWANSVDADSRVRFLQTGKPVEMSEVVMGRENVYRRVFDTLTRAKTEVLVMADLTGLTHPRELIAVLTELNKDVRCRIIETVNAENLQFMEEFSKRFELRHVDEPPLRVVITDSEYLTFATPLFQMPDEAVWTNNGEMVRMMWRIVNDAWNRSQDAVARIAALEELMRCPSLGLRRERT